MESAHTFLVILLCFMRRISAELFKKDDLYITGDDDSDYDGVSGDYDEYYDDYNDADTTLQKVNATAITLASATEDYEEFIDNGAIAGAVFGGLAALCMIAVGCFYFVRARNKQIRELHRSTKVIRTSTHHAGVYQDLTTQEPLTSVRETTPMNIYVNGKKDGDVYEYDSDGFN